MGVFILSQGDAVTFLTRVVDLATQIFKSVTEGYQNKTLKEELKEEKENGKTDKAKSLGAMRGATNEFLEKIFEGKYENYRDPESGLEKRIFKVETGENGYPILKDKNEVEELITPLVGQALKSSGGDINKFYKEFGKRTKEFTEGQLTSLFRNHLIDSKDPKLADYAPTIQTEASIQNLFESIKRKVGAEYERKGTLKGLREKDIFGELKNKNRWRLTSNWQN